jgi:hypothetical protein
LLSIFVPSTSLLKKTTKFNFLKPNNPENFMCIYYAGPPKRGLQENIFAYTSPLFQVFTRKQWANTLKLERHNI